MKKLRGRTWLYIFLVSALFVGAWFAFKPEDATIPGITEKQDKKPTLILWYTDESLTDYLNSACVAYLDAEGVRVEPVLKTGLEYIEEIYDASVKGGEMPDLYIAGTDCLEKAALSGLALPINDPENIMNSFNYPQIAMDAVSYKGRQVAYPFYFDTAFLLYNSTYLSQMADAELRSEPVEGGEDEEGEGRTYVPDAGVPEGYTEESWKEAVSVRTQELIPESIEDITKLAMEHGAPEGMEYFFLWDVSDI